MVHNDSIIGSWNVTETVSVFDVSLEDFAGVNVVLVPAERISGASKKTQPDQIEKEGNCVDDRVEEGTDR